MAAKKSKKESILEFAAAQEGKPFGRGEIRKIQAHLRKRLGAGGQTSESYVTQVLVDAGGVINYPNPFVSPPLEEPYGSKLEGALRFDNLRATEKSIGRLQNLYMEYLEAQDRRGTVLVRRLMTRGRDRARSLAASPRVTPQKRQEKKEIAGWFGVWLDTPDLFFDWLEIRKSSKEFKRRFPGAVA